MIEGIGKAFEVAIKDMIHLCEKEDSKVKKEIDIKKMFC